MIKCYIQVFKKSLNFKSVIISGFTVYHISVDGYIFSNWHSNKILRKFEPRENISLYGIPHECSMLHTVCIIIYIHTVYHKTGNFYSQWVAHAQLALQISIPVPSCTRYRGTVQSLCLDLPQHVQCGRSSSAHTANSTAIDPPLVPDPNQVSKAC